MPDGPQPSAAASRFYVMVGDAPGCHVSQIRYTDADGLEWVQEVVPGSTDLLMVGVGGEWYLLDIRDWTRWGPWRTRKAALGQASSIIEVLRVLPAPEPAPDATPDAAETAWEHEDLSDFSLAGRDEAWFWGVLGGPWIGPYPSRDDAWSAAWTTTEPARKARHVTEARMPTQPLSTSRWCFNCRAMVPGDHVYCPRPGIDTRSFVGGLVVGRWLGRQ